MTVDYDKPRAADTDDLPEDSLDDLTTHRRLALSAVIDLDEPDSAELCEQPLPEQKDEFTCSGCFLVHHRSRLASDKGGQLICDDCA